MLLWSIRGLTKAVAAQTVEHITYYIIECDSLTTMYAYILHVFYRTVRLYTNLAQDSKDNNSQ